MKRHRIFTSTIILLICLLAASITLNSILFGYARHYYMQLNITRLDPLGLNFYEAKDEHAGTVESPKTKALFFGDSRAKQWPAPPGLDQFIFTNRGIGAQTSAQVAERFDEHVESLNPDILIIQLCINDLKTIPLYLHLKHHIIATCKSNLEQIVDQARRQDIAVIVTTLFPLGELPVVRRWFWSDDVVDAIDEVNNFIHSIEGEGVIIFDTAPILADDRGQVQASYSQDFLHLNKAGYTALNQQLTGLLLTVDKERDVSER